MLESTVEKILRKAGRGVLQQVLDSGEVCSKRVEARLAAVDRKSAVIIEN